RQRAVTTTNVIKHPPGPQTERDRSHDNHPKRPGPMKSPMHRSVSPKPLGLDRGYVFANYLTGLLRYRGPAHLEGRTGSGPPVGLEPPADPIDAAGQFNIQAFQVVAGSIAHLK